MKTTSKAVALEELLAEWPAWGNRIARAVNTIEACQLATGVLRQITHTHSAACMLSVEGEWACSIISAEAAQPRVRKAILEAWRTATESAGPRPDIEWGLTTCKMEVSKGTPASFITRRIESDDVFCGLLLAEGEAETDELVGAVTALLGPSLTALRRLRREAYRDATTGILNRAGFEEALHRHVRLAHRHDAPVSVLLLDLDAFKNINDTYGHAGGDAVLRALADRVRGTIRESDVFSRVGGDEFAIVLSQTDPAGADVAARRIATELMRASVEFGAHQIPLFVSIGMAGWMPGDGDPDVEQILQAADKNLYLEKSKKQSADETTT